MPYIILGGRVHLATLFGRDDTARGTAIALHFRVFV